MDLHDKTKKLNDEDERFLQTQLNSQGNIGQCSSSSIDDNSIINKKKELKIKILIFPFLN
ncbi:hypothetical protein A3Q56_08644 [Intoshia linei]|uniref:Uncharacterized protein n=1 Tax=Intoshia linei TaxID=1819745 RepID=A0A177AQG1_9BILA|nr:hypothetical protein A3Q56_08644 [Intoshia linei]